MKSRFEPASLNMRLLRLHQEEVKWEMVGPMHYGTHSLRVRNLHPAVHQEVRISYDTDSPDVGFCRCRSRADCSDDHRTHVQSLTTRDGYWHGEQKAICQELSWPTDAAELDFTLTLTVTSRIVRDADRGRVETDGGYLNMYVTKEAEPQ